MTRSSDLTVQRLYEAAASTAPTPGAGSVTALTGMLGVSLMMKALRITQSHGTTAALDGREGPLEALAQAMAADADADIAAFDAFIQAAKLPHVEEAETAERTRRMHAAVAAGEAALLSLEHAATAISLASEMEESIAAVVMADLHAGRRLAETTRLNAIENAALVAPPAPTAPPEEPRRRTI